MTLPRDPSKAIEAVSTVVCLSLVLGAGGALLEARDRARAEANALGERPSSAEQPVFSRAGGDHRTGWWREVETGGQSSGLSASAARSVQREVPNLDGSRNRSWAEVEASAERLIWPARICFAESELRLADCAAQLHVARKRAARTGATWISTLRAYSSLERSTSHRARRIRSMRWDDFPEPLQELVQAFDRGEIPDPCPLALGWGGRMDRPRPGQIPVRCDVKTANWFYRVAPPRTVRASIAAGRA